MQSNPDFSDPAAVVASFIRAMHCWESVAGTLSSAARARFKMPEPSSMHPEYFRVGQMLQQIPPFLVSIYLTDRKRAYVPGGSYSIPPEWNPATETVTRVIPKTKSQVIVETDRKSDNFGGLREYVVKKQGDCWLIDSMSAVVGGKRMKLTLV